MTKWRLMHVEWFIYVLISALYQFFAGYNASRNKWFLAAMCVVVTYIWLHNALKLAALIDAVRAASASGSGGSPPGAR